MSTKTTFKRIALGTVAAMGFGLLSVAPANAAATDLGGSVVTVTAVSSSSVASNTISKSAVYTAGQAITATINLATTNAMVDVADKATVTVTVTGPSIASPASTSQAVASTLGVTRATAVTGLTFTTSGSTLIQTYVSGSPTKDAKPIGEVTFTPSIPGIYSIVTTTALTGATAAGTAKTVSFTVGGNTQLVPTVGTSISEANFVGAQTGGQATFRYQPTAPTAATITYFATVDTGSIVSVASSGASGTTGTVTTTNSNTNGLNTAGGVTLVGTLAGTYNSGGTDGTGIAPSYWDITLTSPVDATQTLLIKTFNTTTGAVTTVATGVATFGALPTASAALSTAFIGAGTAFPTAEATAGALRFPSTANTTVHATIGVTLKDANGVAITGQSVSATVSGPGLITMTNGNGAGAQGTKRADSITAATNTTNEFRIGISADGTRGVSTITVLRGTTVIATKTVTFYGSVATLTATQGVGVMRSGRTAASLDADFVLGGSSATELAADATTRAKATNISIVAKDVDGNIVPLAVAPTADISDAAVISDVTITSCTGGGALTVCAAGAGNWIASTMPAIGGVSGAKATVTFKTPNPLVPGAFISTAAVPFTLGGTKTGGTVTMTLDKATYEPGERMIITYTAKDAAGNPVADWTSTGTPSSNKAAQGLSGGVYVNGSHIFGDGATELAYAPTAPGAFTVTLATGTSTTATITATATVADDAATTAAAAAGDAAAEATDAANAATDAANAAAEAADAATAAAQDAADAVAALSTSVTAMVDSLRKQITSLTNLVIKIQRKVRA
jgi:trimeric autotransporter adhesin